MQISVDMHVISCLFRRITQNDKKVVLYGMSNVAIFDLFHLHFDNEHFLFALR